jgi:hypothetical protein
MPSKKQERGRRSTTIDSSHLLPVMLPSLKLLVPGGGASGTRLRRCRSGATHVVAWTWCWLRAAGWRHTWASPFPSLDPPCRAVQIPCEHRHHIPKPRYRVTHWAEYDAALRRRGNLTVWFADEAVTAWRAEPRTTPGGQPRYSVIAIATALTMGHGLWLGAAANRGPDRFGHQTARAKPRSA